MLPQIIWQLSCLARSYARSCWVSLAESADRSLLICRSLRPASCCLGQQPDSIKYIGASTLAITLLLEYTISAHYFVQRLRRYLQGSGAERLPRRLNAHQTTRQALGPRSTRLSHSSEQFSTLLRLATEATGYEQHLGVYAVRLLAWTTGRREREIIGVPICIFC